MCGGDISWLRGAFKLAISKALVAIQTLLATRNPLSSLGKIDAWECHEILQEASCTGSGPADNWVRSLCWTPGKNKRGAIEGTSPSDDSGEEKPRTVQPRLGAEGILVAASGSLGMGLGDVVL